MLRSRLPGSRGWLAGVHLGCLSLSATSSRVVSSSGKDHCHLLPPQYLQGRSAKRVPRQRTVNETRGGVPAGHTVPITVPGSHGHGSCCRRLGHSVDVAPPPIHPTTTRCRVEDPGPQVFGKVIRAVRDTCPVSSRDCPRTGAYPPRTCRMPSAARAFH